MVRCTKANLLVRENGGYLLLISVLKEKNTLILQIILNVFLEFLHMKYEVISLMGY